MTVRSLVLIIVAAGLLGVIAEYFFRRMGVVNLGGLSGGLAGIIAAMIINRKKDEKKTEAPGKTKKRR
jgi:membrane associated rhomboid family serine protease